MYKYLARIPDVEFKIWREKFWEAHKEDFPQHPKEDFDETWDSWIDNLRDTEKYHSTKVIKHYELTLASRDFFSKILVEERDRLVDTYPEAFI